LFGGDSKLRLESTYIHKHMTDQIDNNEVQEDSEEPYNESVEKDGLSISVDEETDTISFSWNPETHPQWNYLEEVGKDELIKMMYKQFDIEYLTTEEAAQ
jgi:hypothetical protein